MMPVIVVRPQPGCDATVAAARERGLEAHGFPLFEVTPIAWDLPDPEGVDALLIGSANALRYGGAQLSAFRGKPAYAVGEASAEAARAAELDVVATGSSGLQDLLSDLRRRHRRLLRLAGEVHVELDPPEGVTITERIVYASAPQPMPPELVAMLRSPALVLLHSAEAARNFARQCDEQGIARSNVSLATIGPRVAEAAGTGWARVEAAERPADAALLALAGEMCQNSDGPQETTIEDAPREVMQEEPPTPPLTAAPRRKTGGPLLLVALLAFAAGAGIAGWLGLRGDLARMMPPEAESSGAPGPLAATPTPLASATPGAKPGKARAMDPMSSLETRLAMLEDRLSRANLEANAASGNAARAEGLLVAFAARRLTEKGQKLGYLEDQLKLRFGDAHPLAVDTIITFSKDPVTLDELVGRLDALSANLTGRDPDEGTWSWLKSEFSDLFVLHRASAPPDAGEARLQRAKLLLTSGKTEDAIAQVQSLPGSDAAKAWIADAHRYAGVERALDLIETAAMLEPRRLQDGEGNKVKQPSPLAQPADPVAMPTAAP